MSNNKPARSSTKPENYTGFVVAAAVALLLLGVVVLVSDRLPDIVGEDTIVSAPTTTGSTTKDPAYSEPATPAR